MSTEATPGVSAARASMQHAMKENLREYGLVLALVAIMVFFQVMTNGILFLPVNLTNIVLQNSYIIVMALGMLLVIVAGHIDLSVGAVAGFIGAVAAILMVDYGMNPLLAGFLCIAAGAVIGGIQGYFIAFMKIPSFIVTLAGMLVFKGLLLNVLSGRSVGPFPPLFQLLSAGFIPDVIGPLRLVAPTLNAAGAPIPNTGIVLHSTTMVIGILIVLAMLYFALKSRRDREGHGYDAEPFAFFVIKNLVMAGILLFLMYKFASFKGLPNVLVVMGILIALFVFITKRMTFGRRIYAMGGNVKAAALSGIHTERLTFYIFVIMGMLAALAGLIYSARLNMATPKAGAGLELDVIAAVFVGGASALGGVGQVTGAVIGAFIMGIMNNGMGVMGINIDWQQVIKGLVLLGAVVFDVYNKNKA
ncbi:MULTISPECIES: multiple monosaccharide ABC transporter permease [unclassified Mesorhizobium]|jgi:putative multiple sugar transport system permease protein|uniref:multiple monosaccharide ABC transporter permease n=1 Tax=unclassified Mesorhizobium TaxID=325217 RepID=UPI0008EA0E94|nr:MULTISPECIES: multiple monosaccharide ABC transporter permease [unclassified Mesorhizobium]RJG41076.1 sugar ABC transporter permease [Mesorhizobium sp. DCY119]SFT58867.1 multiple monosaccharide ABC transporter membrane protein [Mesorhizobium sp. YR577]